MRTLFLGTERKAGATARVATAFSDPTVRAAPTGSSSCVVNRVLLIGLISQDVLSPATRLKFAAGTGSRSATKIRVATVSAERSGQPIVPIRR